MLTDRTLSRNACKTVAALLAAGLVFTVGLLATAYQINYISRDSAYMAAQHAISRIDALLRESDKAAHLARPMLSQPCNDMIRNELNRLTIEQKHVRVISLIHAGWLTCSSFSGARNHPVDVNSYIDHRLSLRRGSDVSADSQIVVLLTAFPEGTVATSIDSAYLSDILLLTGAQTPLFVQAGDIILTAQGEFRSIEVNEGDISLQSTVFPYSIRYPGLQPLLPGTFIRKGPVLLTLFALLAVLTGVLVWRRSFRMLTPYDQLARGIRNKEIEPWYQPVICSYTGEIHGVEVLARWKTPDRTMIPPDAFIPLAEKSGLIIPLTRHLMSCAAVDLAPIIKRVNRPFHIGFNISAAHIRAVSVKPAPYVAIKPVLVT